MHVPSSQRCRTSSSTGHCLLFVGTSHWASVQGALLGDGQLSGLEGYGARPWQKICSSSSQGLAAREHLASGSGGGISREPSTIPRVHASTNGSRQVGRLLLQETTARRRAAAGCCAGRLREVLMAFDRQPNVAEPNTDTSAVVTSLAWKRNVNATFSSARTREQLATPFLRFTRRYTQRP